MTAIVSQTTQDDVSTLLPELADFELIRADLRARLEAVHGAAHRRSRSGWRPGHRIAFSIPWSRITRTPPAHRLRPRVRPRRAPEREEA